MKKWFLYNKKADFQGIAERFHIDQVTARILRNREVNSDSQIEEFLNGTPELLHSPLLLPDAIRCMNRLDRDLQEKNPIRIVGDYDVDGVMATYILYAGLRKLGANVDYVIPDRIRDGYGINLHIVEAAVADGIRTILTCDNGISAMEELKYAREKGIAVLVTDHHDVRQCTEEDYGCESRDLLPPANAVVNPKRESSRYPFPEICGAVVAWKMVQLLYQKRNLPPEEAEEFLPFAAIATVCDVVKLQDENRIIVRYGLEGLKTSANPGLQALLEVTGLLEQEKLSAWHAGFILGPCINAGGRLESAMVSLELFLSENRQEALPRAIRLKELNDARKAMTREATEEACRQVTEQHMEEPVLVVYLPELHESLAGIVAGRLKERFYRPAFVITDAEDSEEGEKMAKGSGRSIEGYPMADRLAENAALLSRFGGHPMAAGFSLKRDNVEALRLALNRRSALTREMLTEKLWIDVPMPVDYISMELVKEFQRLEPFGQGNEKPKFATKDLAILGTRVLGNNRNVVRMEVMTKNHTRMDAVYFGDGDAFLREKGNFQYMDLVYYPVINEYNGRSSLQLNILDYQLK